jgi:hypothetical protein
MALLKQRPDMHMPHVIGESELRPLDLGGLLARGAIAGIVAGMSFLLADMWFAVSQGKPAISPLYAISTVFHASKAPAPAAAEPVLGLATHIVLSLGFGMGFAVLLVPWLRNLPALVAGALGWGLALWVLNIQILGRTVFPFFATKGTPDLIFTLLNHVLIFGLLLAPFFLGHSLAGPRRPAGRQASARAAGREVR